MEGARQNLANVRAPFLAGTGGMADDIVETLNKVP